MNRHSEIISTIFNSNTNVILAIVGGAMMYVALYASKDTHEEDVSDYARAGNAIIKKLFLSMEKHWTQKMMSSTQNVVSD